MYVDEEANFNAALRRYEAKETTAQAALILCDNCGQMCDPDEMEELDGDRLCNACADAFYSNEAFTRFGAGYLARSAQRHIRPYIGESEKEFCVQSDDWREYVRERIEAEWRDGKNGWNNANTG